MISWVISLPVGLVVGVVVWTLFQVFRAVPIQDRAFLDRPPRAFRVFWPLIQTLSHYCDRRLSEAYRDTTTLRLKQAGIEYSLSPPQYFSGKLLCSMLCALVVLLSSVAINRIPAELCLLAAVGGYFFPGLWLKEITEKRKLAILHSLPFYLDVITLALESGSNLTGGITKAVQKSADSPLRNEFSRALRDIRAGKTRVEALRAVTERSGSHAVKTVISSMIQAERVGSSLGPVLRAHSEQLRNQRFLKAEKLAMEAPVKLLAPLVLCIFPTTFLVIGFVILSKAIQANIITWAPLLWAYGWPG